MKRKGSHDKSANSLPELEVGQPVYVQSISGHHNTDWEPAVCRKKLTDKSYLVQLNGKTYHRNRINLKPRVTDHDYSKDAQMEIPDDTSPALVTNTNTHSSTDSTSPVNANTTENKQNQNMSGEVRRNSRNRKQHTPYTHIP